MLPVSGKKGRDLEARESPSRRTTMKKTPRKMTSTDSLVTIKLKVVIKKTRRKTLLSEINLCLK